MIKSDLHKHLPVCNKQKILELLAIFFISIGFLNSCNYKGRDFFEPPTGLTTPNGEVNLMAPVLLYPANGATGLDYMQTFEWNSVESATFYEFQLAEEGQSFMQGMQFETNTNMFEYDELELQTSYSWRVQAGYEDLRSPWSETWGFRTMDPQKLDAPELVSPENGATNVEIPVKIKWNSVSGADFGYRLQLSTEVTFEDELVVDEDVEGTEFDATNLEHDTYYWWRVRANGGSERSDPLESDWSAIRGFTTIPEAPTSIHLENPTVCVEHGTNQSLIVWLWFLSNNFGFDLVFNMKIVLPNGTVEEITAISPNNAVKLLFFLDIFTFGNYEWEVISVVNQANGAELQLTGNTSGVVNVGDQQQNPGSCN